MRISIVTLTICFLIIFTRNVNGQSKLPVDILYSSAPYSGVSLVFKPDMTFTLKYHGHISSDTASGTYRIDGDTIFISYVYKKKQ